MFQAPVCVDMLLIDRLLKVSLTSKSGEEGSVNFHCLVWDRSKHMASVTIS